MKYNREAVINACKELANRIDGFDVANFMMPLVTAAFEASLPSESVTLKVHFSAPVNQDGTATIYSSGRLECKINH